MATGVRVKKTELVRPLFQGMTTFLVMVVLLAGCATGSNQKLEIDTSRVPAVDNLPGEIRLMLEDLGYEVIPETAREKFEKTFSDYSMRFRARDVTRVRVDVQVMLVDKIARIHIYKTDEKTASAATIQRYEAIRKEAVRRFGEDSVK